MRRRMSLDELDAAIDRWQRRLFRASNALEIYTKARKRIVARQDREQWVNEQNPETGYVSLVSRPMLPDPAIEIVKEPADDLTIPTFLRQQPNARDDAAKADILAQQEAAKKEKTTARIAKMKADKSGERKKMPLQGKAALAAIKGDHAHHQD